MSNELKDDAILKYLEDNDVHYELALYANGEVVRRVEGFDLDSIEEQMHKLQDANTEYANEELVFSQYEFQTREAE